SGGVTPYHYSIVVGSLPAGLFLNPTTGEITGTLPPAPLDANGFPQNTTVNFTVSVVDSAFQPMTRTRFFSIFETAHLTITTTRMPDAIAPWNYGFCFNSNRPSSSTTWSITSGALPDGLGPLPADGCIPNNRWPRQTGSFTLDARVQSGTEVATRTFTLRA